MEPREFSQEEFGFVIQQALQLQSRGILTGVNFIQSQTPLPSESVLVHFLQKRLDHIEYVQQNIATPSVVVPRYTFYAMKPSYFKKSDFEEQYGKATFFDAEMKGISKEEAKILRTGVVVANTELDLLIPIEESSLVGVVEKLMQSDRTGPCPWEDPVVIVKSKSVLPQITDFVGGRNFISINRLNEEFYSVISDEERTLELKRFIRNSCKSHCVGSLAESSLVFDPCQINKKFEEYIKSTIKPLPQLE